MSGQSYRINDGKDPMIRTADAAELCAASISPAPTRETRTRRRYTAIPPGCRRR